MSKTRLVLWLMVPLLALAVVLLAPRFLARDNDKVTRANFDTIKLGMPRGEVEAILGTGQEISKEASQEYGASFHSYLGEPPAHNRILVWTRGMRSIVLYLQDDKVVAMRTSLKAGE